MKNLNASFKQPSPTIPSWIIKGFFIFSLLGFIDAAYLAAKYYIGKPVECSFLKGCETVTTSQYAAVGGISVALLGAIYYLTIFTLTIVYLEYKKEAAVFAAARATIVGLLASIWFLYIQFFVLKAICVYCLASAATSTALFIFAIFLLKYKNMAEQ